MISKQRATATLRDIERADIPDRLINYTSHPGVTGASIPHHRLVYEIETALVRRKFKVQGFRAELTREGHDIAMSFSVSGAPFFMEDCYPTINVVATNSRRFKVRAFFGGWWNKTEITLITGDLVGSRYTTKFDVALEVDKVVTEWQRQLPDTERWCRDFGGKLVKDRATAERCILYAGRERLVPWSRLGKIYNKWSNTLGTKWDMMAAFGEGLKSSCGYDQLINGFKLFHLMKNPEAALPHKGEKCNG